MQRVRTERQVITFLAFLSVLLAFGIDVSLPAFDELRDHFDLAEGSGDVSLVVTFYFLGMAAGQVLYGPFADRFGRLPVLTVGLAVYALGAAGAAAATSIEMLLGARLVWGLGAASAAVLYPAIARDLYEGDRMARIMTLVMAVFLLGPMIAPSVGELLLLTGSWRSVFAFGLVLAAIALAWSRRFGETLPEERRRSLDFSETAAAFRAVLGSRPTIGYMLSVTFAEAAFFTYLGSGQPVIDEIYGYGDWFALIFAAASVVIAAALFASTRYTNRHGAAPVAHTAAATIVALGGLLLLVCLATEGTPPFWLWFALVAPALAAMSIVTPTALSLALEPMERMAGTAMAVIGMVSLGGAAVLAAVVDRLIDDTVTPMAVAFVVYGAMSAAFMRWGREDRGVVAGRSLLDRRPAGRR